MLVEKEYFKNLSNLKVSITVKNLLKCKKDVIQVYWQPQYCLFEKIVNHNKIDQKNFDPYQRIITYELQETSLNNSVKIF